jgi:hypothetical protein
MFHLKNPYQDEFDEEMEKYTAHKPEMQSEDSEDEDIRQKIFGIEGGDGL